MILVTLGTQDKQFTRLLKLIDKKIEEKVIKEEVIAQIGYTKYESKNMKLIDFLDEKKFEELLNKSRLVITHAGVGTILNCIKLDKPVIATPRLVKYQEHQSDHQIEIIQEFEKEGFILALNDFNDFNKIYKEAKNFHPKKLKSNNKKFIKNIEDYIEKDNHRAWFNR